MSPKTIMIAVVGLAVNAEGKFLLTQRNQPQDPDVHGKWQLPGGGMEYGESPEQTLARELQEELTLSAQILFPNPMAKTSVWDLKSESFHVTLLCYVISIGDQTPVIGDPETLSFKWYTPNEIATLDCLPFTRELVEEAMVMLKK